jgi:hypothetical protein
MKKYQQKGLNNLFGTTKKRILRPGEEATIIENIEKFFEDVINSTFFITKIN